MEIFEKARSTKINKIVEKNILRIYNRDEQMKKEQKIKWKKSRKDK